jgi:hypothetical protein
LRKHWWWIIYTQAKQGRWSSATTWAVWRANLTMASETTRLLNRHTIRMSTCKYVCPLWKYDCPRVYLIGTQSGTIGPKALPATGASHVFVLVLQLRFLAEFECTLGCRDRRGRVGTSTYNYLCSIRRNTVTQNIPAPEHISKDSHFLSGTYY